MAAITFDAVYDAGATPSDTIDSDMFGLNLSAGNQSTGGHDYQIFDEVADHIGVTNVRWPGGVAAEQLLVPTLDGQGNVTWNLNDDNTGMDQTLDVFLDWCGKQNVGATITIPTALFASHSPSANPAFLYDAALNAMSYDNTTKTYFFDDNHTNYANFEAAVVSFVEMVLDRAAAQVLPATISAFELGNEYASFINAKKYGALAAEMTRIVDEVLEGRSEDPNILVQIRNDVSNGSSTGIQDLIDKNDQVLDYFDANTLDKVDGVVTHYYFQDKKTIGVDDPDEFTQAYDNIDDRLEDMGSLVAAWGDKSWHMTEWNVHAPPAVGLTTYTVDGKKYADVTQAFIDETNWGMKQLAPLLEMLASFSDAGVDGANFWSTQYHATSLGKTLDDGDFTQLAGDFMALVKDSVAGKRHVELGVDTADHDAHFFSDDDEGVLFVASRTDSAEQQIEIDLWSLGISATSINVTYLETDASNAGPIKEKGVTYVDGAVAIPDWFKPDGNLEERIETMEVQDGKITLSLDAYELAKIEFDLPDVWTGTTGDNVHTGTDQAEYLIGNGGDDWLRGEGGDDVLIAGNERSSLYGGLGNDVVIGGSGNDYLAGGAGEDHLVGNAGDDRLAGGSGADVLNGGAGSDTAVYAYETSGVTMNLATGATSGAAAGDILLSVENLEGTEFADELHGDASDNRLEGRGGDDLLFSGSGVHVFDGGAGEDTVDYSAEIDKMGVNLAAQSYWWGAEFDQISNVENLIGSDFNDNFQGTNGNNILRGGLGNDTLRGRHGFDTLYGDEGNDVLEGGTGNFNDVLYGGTGDDTLSVAGGRNWLYGQQGNDTVTGHDGDDVIHGGGHNDTLTGGGGEDTFYFTHHEDVITDFTVDEDKILLRRGIWGGGDKTDAEILAYATVDGGNLVFDFGGGHELTLIGITDETTLEGHFGLFG